VGHFGTTKHHYIIYQLHLLNKNAEVGVVHEKQIPLRLARSKTLHTFEGSDAGATPEGKPKNSIQTVVIDVGERADEARNHGLTYTEVSKPTTLGDAGSKDIIIPDKNVSIAAFT
jgi:hypothetical protein